MNKKKSLILCFCLSLFCTMNAQAKLALNVGIIYKKGIGKGFFLSTEQHSIEQVDEFETVSVQMKNGIRAELAAFYVRSKEYGPSGFVRIKGGIYNQKGKLVKTLNDPTLDIYLENSKKVVYEEGEEQIELDIRPASI